MTELQTGLIGLGAVAVVGVVAYNKWQEYRHRKLAEQVLKAQHADVLLDAVEANTEADVREIAAEASPQNIAGDPVAPSLFSERIEPVLRLDPDPDEPSIGEPDSSVASDAFPEEEAVSVAEPAPAPLPEPVFEPVPEPVPEHAHVESRPVKDLSEPLSLLSPAIDYVVSLETVELAPAYQILEAQQNVMARVHKPVHWIGYNEHLREWEAIADHGENAYRHLRVGLQLVDRQGPVREVDLSVFIVAMQDLADEMMAIADVPPRQAALEEAAKLDEFCASVDIQIGINVISQGQVFPGTKLRALAEAAGMVIDAEGRFVRCDDDGNVLYVLLNQEASGFSIEAMKTMNTHGVTFLLDVPRVGHGERVFNQMVDLARRFAEVLHGALVDDNRRPLSEGALEPIRRQVGQYQSIMAAQGMPAGHPLTRRLFS